MTETAEQTQPAAQEKRVAAFAEAFDVSDKGVMTLHTLDQQLNYAKWILQKGLVSETFKTPEQVLIGIQFALALKVDPKLLLRKMYVVNGTPALYGEGPLSLVQCSPAFWRIREYFVNDDGDEICPKNKNLKSNVYASVTEILRKGDDEKKPQIDFFTLDDLAKAKLDIGRNGRKDVWEKWERIMMRYKSRTMSLRSKFADHLVGIPIAEYDFHYSPETPMINVNEKKNTTAQEINSLFLEEFPK